MAPHAFWLKHVRNHKCQCAVKDEVLTLSTAYEVDYELVMVQLLWDHVGWQIIQFNVKLTHNTIFSYLRIRDFMNFMMKKILNILTLIWNKKLLCQRIRNSDFHLYYLCSIMWYSTGYKALLKRQPESQTTLDHLIPAFSSVPLNVCLTWSSSYYLRHKFCRH